MQLLLTRGAEEAERTRVSLEARGHRVLLSPVLHFAGTGEPLPRRAPGAIIATSARAFAHAGTPTWDTATVPLALVGGRTEGAARAAGFDGPATVAETAAELAAQLRHSPATRLLYLAGTDRKPDLEAALAAGPHRLSVVETYAAAPAATLAPEAGVALRGDAVDAVLHYSRRSAVIFLQLCAAAGIDPRAAAHLCLSPDVAAAFERPCRARVAAAPNEAALLALLPGF